MLPDIRTKKPLQQQCTPVEWNGKKGQIILKGVEDDQYIWTELETANGCTLLKNNIDVTIKSVDDANRSVRHLQQRYSVLSRTTRYNFPNNEDYKLANIPQKQLAHKYQTASATVDGNDVTMLGTMRWMRVPRTQSLRCRL